MRKKPCPKNLKLKGVFKGRDVDILIDSGSTHNGINIDLVKQLDLFICPIKDLTVPVTTGNKFK